MENLLIVKIWIITKIMNWIKNLLKVNKNKRKKNIWNTINILYNKNKK